MSLLGSNDGTPTPTVSSASTSTGTPAGWTWGSLAVAVGSASAAGVSDLWPGHSVPVALQVTLTGIAGLLTALHVHLPKWLNRV